MNGLEIHGERADSSEHRRATANTLGCKNSRLGGLFQTAKSSSGATYRGRWFLAETASTESLGARALPWRRCRSREAVFAVVAGFLGWTLDAFDFFLVARAADDR